MKTQPRPLTAAAVILVLSVLVACTPGGGGSTAVPAASAVPGSPLVNPPSTNPSPSTAGKPGY